MRAEVVGQAAVKVAKLAGFKVPAETSVLVAEPDGIGAEHPLSYEILAPVLALLSRGELRAGDRHLRGA